MRFPNTVGELIAQLDKQFPEVAVTAGMPHDEIMFRGGQREVVQFIKRWRDGASFASVAPEAPRGRGRPTR